MLLYVLSVVRPREPEPDVELVEEGGSLVGEAGVGVVPQVDLGVVVGPDDVVFVSECPLSAVGLLVGHRVQVEVLRVFVGNVVGSVAAGLKTQKVISSS